MQRPPSSTAISRVASGCRIDNKLATELADRLRRIISPRQYPFYVLLETAAFRLGEKQQLSYFGESRPDKVRPAYKTITALTLGARSYEEIETLDLLTDEALSPRQLGFRRDEQAVHLERALLPFVGEVSDFDNDNLAAYTRVFVEIWQPSAKEFDPVDELLTTPGALNEVSFKEVCEVLESHCLGPALPPVKALFKGLAFAVQCFYRGLRVGQLPLHVAVLVENLGIHATAYTNTDSPPKVRRAVSVFQILWGLGHVPAGLHLAQSYYQYTNEPELHDRAAKLIDMVWLAWRANPHEFTDPGSILTLFQLRARARSDVILHCADESKVSRATVDLIDALYQAGKLDQKFKIELYHLLTGRCEDVSVADPESLDAVRWRIHQFPSAKEEWQRALDSFLHQPLSEESRGGENHE